MEEEEKFLKERKSSQFIDKIGQYLGTTKPCLVKEISFDKLWDNFWYQHAPHYVLWNSHKVAIVYAHNSETDQFIGGLIDITPKRSQWEFLQKYSVENRELILVDMLTQ